MIFDIKRFAINDGPGIRTAVFLKGCPLDCWWCHNPEGRSQHSQLMVRSNRCALCGECVGVCSHRAIHLDQDVIYTDFDLCQHCGTCVEACVNEARELVGRSVTVEQVLAEIERDVVFYDQSGGGVTLTGGEPLFQPGFSIELLRACKTRGIHTTLDTSGYVAWDILAEAATYTDLFLYDLKLMDDNRHRKYTGVSNQRILNNLQRLALSKTQILVRIPLIPGVNDDEENLRLTGEFLANLQNIPAVELLPYHDIARAKYSALELEYRIPEVLIPSAERLEWARTILQIHP